MIQLSWIRPFVLAGLCAVTAQAWANPAATEKPYVPERGQMGKDVIWIPTPKGLIDKMLTAAKVTSNDRLFDLGAGDGIIAITAAKEFGAQSVGIEFNPQMADYARRMVKEAGVSRHPVPVARPELAFAPHHPAHEAGHPRGVACLHHGRLGARRDHGP